MADGELFTIGFTRKTAEEFFTLLRQAGVRRVLDIRLNNVSQLAGFTKQDDLAFFLREIAGMEYRHMAELAPTQALIDLARKRQEWDRFEAGYRRLIRTRKVEDVVSRQLLDGACLLCSEEQPEHCHRRVLADYLVEHFEGLQVRHLV
ncbi:MAG: DUF488 domain-containing protein [Gemmatimonadetes bacterium]|nr:DUF488 domain-containing protein [Gemmatimonadota bacterium]